MLDLLNAEHVAETTNKANARESSNMVRLEDGETPIWVLSTKYDYGYVHWVDLDNNRIVRVVCAGGKEGEGWAHDECMLCAFVRSKYTEARNTSNKREAAGLKQEAGRIRAKFEVSMVVAKGIMVMQRFRSNGKFKNVSVPVFDSGDVQVGILQMSNAQYKSFVGLVDSEDFDFIESGADLTNRPIIFDKKKRGNDAYKTVQCRPGTRKAGTVPEEIEWDESAFDLGAVYKVDTDQIEECVAELNGGADVDDEDDAFLEEDDGFDDEDEDEDE